jgi:SPP1 family predicted phage head-tail adaptor
MAGIGSFRHLVVLEEPGPVTPDADGGYTDSWTPLDPTVWACSIAPVTARDLEALGAGSVLAQATHVVKGRYHPGITTQARLTFDNRTLNVVYVANRDERDIETDLVCAEVVK